VKYRIAKKTYAREGYNEAGIMYELIDENNNRHLWCEWSNSLPLTRYIDGDKPWLNICVHIPLNENDPQESIDRIKKLVMLK
jgi:hypothetical protein